MSTRHQRATSDLAQLLREKAPPKPDCFRSQSDWVAYLHSCEQSQVRVVKLVGRTGKGEANRGRIKTRELEQEINYCADCGYDNMLRMQRMGKCHPPAWGTVPKAPSAKPPKPAKTKTPPLPAVAVVSLNLSTWAVRVFNDLRDVSRAGFSRDAVLLSIRSGQPYKGHAWKTAEEFRKNPPVALPKAVNALSLLVERATSTQAALPLEQAP